MTCQLTVESGLKRSQRSLKISFFQQLISEASEEARRRQHKFIPEGD
jgi:hypothetical protein